LKNSEIKKWYKTFKIREALARKVASDFDRLVHVGCLVDVMSNKLENSRSPARTKKRIRYKMECLKKTHSRLHDNTSRSWRQLMRFNRLRSYSTSVGENALLTYWRLYNKLGVMRSRSSALYYAVYSAAIRTNCLALCDQIRSAESIFTIFNPVKANLGHRIGRGRPDFKIIYRYKPQVAPKGIYLRQQNDGNQSIKHKTVSTTIAVPANRGLFRQAAAVIARQTNRLFRGKPELKLVGSGTSNSRL